MSGKQGAPGRRAAGPLLAVILLVALALRVWQLHDGLPFAYNADEAEHFVPKAIAIAGGGGLDPGYYENPPALTYLLSAVFALRFESEIDPEAAFLSARIVVALIGTLVVALAYWAGTRFAERRVGLVAAALMAVAFLPVFYSKQALNDIVALAPISVGLVASLLVYERGRWSDWALAGAAIGAATATKYTAGAMLVTIAVAAGLRLHGDRREARRVALGLALAGAAFLVAFAALNPYALLNASEARGKISGQSAQADTGKLGHDDTYGWLYYVESLTWGLGWLPLLAALAGAVVAFRRNPRTALLLLVFPLCFYLYMGAQGRFFGRWLLPPIRRCACWPATRSSRLRAGAPLSPGSPCWCACRAPSPPSTSTPCWGAPTRASRRAGGSQRASPPARRWSSSRSCRRRGAKRWTGRSAPSNGRSRRTRSGSAPPGSTPTAPTASAGWWSARTRRTAGSRRGSATPAATTPRWTPRASARRRFSPFAEGEEPVPFSYDDVQLPPACVRAPGPGGRIDRLRDCTPAAG